MPAKPRALLIVEAIRDRLQSISAGADYFTSAGSHVALGRIDQPNDEDDTIDARLGVISTEEDSQQSNLPRLTNQIEVHVVGFRRYDGTDSETKAQELIADIKRAALDYSDRSLGGLARFLVYSRRSIIYPEGSSRYVAVDVSLIAEFIEQYGDPQA